MQYFLALTDYLLDPVKYMVVIMRFQTPVWSWNLTLWRIWVWGNIFRLVMVRTATERESLQLEQLLSSMDPRTRPFTRPVQRLQLLCFTLSLFPQP